MQCIRRQPKRTASQENILLEQSRRVAALNGIRLGKGQLGQTLGTASRFLLFSLRRGSAPPYTPGLFLSSQGFLSFRLPVATRQMCEVLRWRHQRMWAKARFPNLLLGFLSCL